MNERYQLLAAMNGVAIKCLVAFVWEAKQLTITELEPLVGHDKNTVRKALAQLSLYGLAAQVVSSQETWHLTDKGYQLPLPFKQIGPGDPAGDGGVMSSVGEKFSPPSSSSSININSSQKQILTTTSTRGENFTTNLDALHRLGIMGTPAEELAGLEWMTPDYAAFHVGQVRREGQRTGLAVYRMRNHFKIVTSPLNMTTEDRKNKYLGGEFGKHIQS